MFERYGEIVTVQELAKMLKVGRNTAYELVRADIIQNIKVGRQIRITKRAVVDYIERHSRITPR